MIDTELLIVISVDIVLLLIAGCVIIFGILATIERPDITQMFYSTRQYAYCTLKGLRDLPHLVCIILVRSAKDGGEEKVILLQCLHMK